MYEVIGFKPEAGQYFDALTDFVCETDLNGNIIATNKALAEIAGKIHRHLLNRKLVDFFHPDDLEKVVDQLAAINQKQEIKPLVVRFRMSKSDYRYVEWRTASTQDRILWISRDITSEMREKELMQQIVNASEDFLEMLPEEIDFQKIAEQLKEISGASFVVVNIFEENGKDYTTIAIAGINATIRKASKILGFPLTGKKWPWDPVREELTRSHNISSFESLMVFAGHALPSLAINLIVNTFQVGEVILAKIEKDGIILGDFTMFMAGGKKFSQHALVEIFTSQVVNCKYYGYTHDLFSGFRASTA